MNYYVKKDLTTIVRAKKANNVFFAMRQGLTVPALKKEGYMVEYASISTPGLITRDFLSTFEFERDYTLTDLDALDMVKLGALITSFAAADTSRPTVASTSPTNNGTDVALDATVTVTFNEAIQVLSGKTAVIYGFDQDTGEFVKIEDATSMTVGGDGNKTLTIGHSAFSYLDVIKVVIPADTIEDTSANTNNYNTAYSFTFTVVDTPALTITETSPAPNAIDVAINVDPTVTFSNEMDTTNEANDIKLKAGDVEVPGTVTWDITGKIATIAPTDDLTNNTVYTIYINAVDIYGHQVASSGITFTTVG